MMGVFGGVICIATEKTMMQVLINERLGVLFLFKKFTTSSGFRDNFWTVEAKLNETVLNGMENAIVLRELVRVNRRAAWPEETPLR